MCDEDIAMNDITIKTEDISGDYETVYMENDEEYDVLKNFEKTDTQPPLNVYKKFTEKDFMGCKFASLQEVVNFMSQFENFTGNKYWKRSTRTIQGSNIKRQINSNLFYYEIKYTCVHGGLAFKSRSKGIRKTSSNKMGCPSHITFRASDDGQYLKIKSLNLSHEGHYGLRTNVQVRLPTECSESDQESDDWDDSALIKAYDKAVNLAKEEVSKRINEGNQIPNARRTKLMPSKKSTTEQTNTNSNQWKTGDSCRATYSEDGEIYEATILEINQENGTCIVEYLGYGNTERVDLSSLKTTAGAESRKAQVEAAKTENESYEANCNGDANNDIEFENRPSAKPPSAYTFEPFSMDMPPAPPLPPQLMAKLPENDTDALSSMLMSWYVSGFHTGYYHGLKHARENSSRSNR